MWAELLLMIPAQNSLLKAEMQLGEVLFFYFYADSMAMCRVTLGLVRLNPGNETKGNHAPLLTFIVLSHLPLRS
jgi:hypothetical protein